MNQVRSFKELNLSAPISKALEQMHFLHPTPVQAEAIPPALRGRDVLATAQTGTGKTAAFAIPLLSFLAANPRSGALILAPTRELAAQIHQVLKDLGRGLNVHGVLVIGGESFHRQAQELRAGADYLVATPGRLNDHLEQGTVALSQVGFLVLDEVDRMLDMGFAPQIHKVMKLVPKKRQTLLFSATFPREIESLAKSLLTEPVRIAIGPPVAAPVSQVSTKTIRTSPDGKNAVILRELQDRDGKVIVFTRTKSRTDRLAKLLGREGHEVVSLHGGRSQGQRKAALERFRTGSHRILVATDLAGRGIDVDDIQHVINYDIPATREDYIHRVGRTGRQGKGGNALNLLVTGDREGERIIGEKSNGRSSGEKSSSEKLNGGKPNGRKLVREQVRRGNPHRSAPTPSSSNRRFSGASGTKSRFR